MTVDTIPNPLVLSYAIVRTFGIMPAVVSWLLKVAARTLDEDLSSIAGSIALNGPNKIMREIQMMSDARQRAFTRALLKLNVEVAWESRDDEYFTWAIKLESTWGGDDV